MSVWRQRALAHPGIALAQIAQALVLDKPHLARRDRAQAAVQDLQVQALEVGNIAGDVEGRDLAPAFPRDLVGAGEALQERADREGRSPSRTMSWSALEVHDLHGQIGERVPLVVAEGGDALKLADERRGRGSPPSAKMALPCVSGGSARISQPSAPIEVLIVPMTEELSHINEFPSLIYVNLRHSYPIHELSPLRNAPSQASPFLAVQGEAEAAAAVRVRGRLQDSASGRAPSPSLRSPCAPAQGPFPAG